MRIRTIFNAPYRGITSSYKHNIMQLSLLSAVSEAMDSADSVGDAAFVMIDDVSSIDIHEGSNTYTVNKKDLNGIVSDFVDMKRLTTYNAIGEI